MEGSSLSLYPVWQRKMGELDLRDAEVPHNSLHNDFSLGVGGNIVATYDRP